MTDPVEPLELGRYRRIVVLTGAGISVASGLRPYRGPGGVWEEEGVATLADVSQLERDPHAVWKLFGPLRAQALAASPNAAHRALTAAQQRLAPGASLTVITQNIDGLHQRAGTHGVIELHGSAFRTRCVSPSCTAPPFDDTRAHGESLPHCPQCGAPQRPDIVLFNEAIPVDAEWAAKKALRDCELFLAVGTSGSVAPASNFVRAAEYAGARTVLVNLEPMRPRHPAFHQEILGRAEEVLPALLGVAWR